MSIDNVSGIAASIWRAADDEQCQLLAASVFAGRTFFSGGSLRACDRSDLLFNRIAFGPHGDTSNVSVVFRRLIDPCERGFGLIDQFLAAGVQAAYPSYVLDTADMTASIMVPGQCLPWHRDDPYFREFERATLPEWLVSVAGRSEMFTPIPALTIVLWLSHCQGGELEIRTNSGAWCLSPEPGNAVAFDAERSVHRVATVGDWPPGAFSAERRWITVDAENRTAVVDRALASQRSAARLSIQWKARIVQASDVHPVSTSLSRDGVVDRLLGLSSVGDETLQRRERLKLERLLVRRFRQAADRTGA